LTINQLKPSRALDLKNWYYNLPSYDEHRLINQDLTTCHGRRSRRSIRATDVETFTTIRATDVETFTTIRATDVETFTTIRATDVETFTTIRAADVLGEQYNVDDPNVQKVRATHVTLMQ
jgi:hypothetical protein